MIVKDLVTGATLESNDELVTASWIERPERYVLADVYAPANPPKNKRQEKTEKQEV